MENLEKTQPSSINQDDSNPKKLKPRKSVWVILGLLIVLIGSALGYFFGSQDAMVVRAEEKEKAVITIATTQYQLGIRELEEGKFENARKRFEYVIQLIPSFPGAQEKLTEVMFAQANIATSTPIPSPTLTPIPDSRGEEELLNQIQVYVQNQDWDSVIVTLDSLRKLNIEYHAVEVDDYYYLALRNRGVRRILQEGSLEPGIYDLALAERFGPLDDEAINYRTWARYYISGASFWGVDWARVVESFAEIYPALPNMIDSSGMTAQERYRVGLIKWGDQLAIQEEWCAAYEKYEMAFAFVVDEKVAPTATAVYNECHKSEETQAPITTETPTPTISITVNVTETPTVAITEPPVTETPAPSNTP
ncbi:MAG: hypothetical protein ACYDH1_15740 [Anaerolineaceae bacterium]